MPKTSTLKEEIREELVGYALLALGIFVSFCLWKGDTSNDITSIGAIGSFFYRVLNSLCGKGRILVPIFLCIAAISKLTKRSKYDRMAMISLVGLLLSILAILHLNLGLEVNAFASGWQGLGGGLLGALLLSISLILLGQGGSYIFWGVVIIVSAVGLAKRSLVDIVKQSCVHLKHFLTKTRQELIDFLFEQVEITEQDEIEEKRKRKTKETKKIAKEASALEGSGPLIIDHLDNLEPVINEESDASAIMDSQSSVGKVEKAGSPQETPDDSSAKTSDTPTEAKVIPPETYILPPLTLLKTLTKVKSLRLNKDITDNVRILEDTLDSFGVKARVTQVSRGPSITRYELQPPPGIKVSRIVNLADDIALSLATPQVRIEAPIPGKAAVGIEVPNEEIAMVYLREILETVLLQESPSKLTVALGKDIAGNPIVADLAKMPHLLIAGATGAGKSVCMNALIASLLFKTSPNEVKMLMIDPKVVELSTFNGVAHLVAPVVTDPKKAASALRWVIHEMENRYELFAGLGVKDIQRYNEIMKKEAGEVNFPSLPYIVVLIDELADLMMVAPADVEDAICRLAQMARAAGIHLVIATQRPSVDVITGVIKANIPSRIAFAVSSQIDSRTILDMGGAEHLLGRGDMLFYPTGMAKPIRVQGVYVSDQEIEALVNFLKEQNKLVNTTEPWGNGEIETSENIEEDPLISEAAKIFIESGQASISLLQRRLRIGYNRAARLIDQMEEQGIVGGYEGSKPRAIRMTWEEYEKTYGKTD